MPMSLRVLLSGADKRCTIPGKLLLLLALAFCFASMALADARTVVFPVRTGEWSHSLNGIWKFKYLPAMNIARDSLFYKPEYSVTGWDSILVPGNWDMQGFGELIYQGVKEGTGLYRMTFRLSSSWREKQVFLLFDGVLYTADVYLNGHYLGHWTSAYNPVTFNATRFIEPDSENVLAVKVTSGAVESAFDINDAWAFSGIFRDVTLFATTQTFFKDYRIETGLSGNAAQVTVSVVASSDDPKNKKLVKGDLVYPDGKTCIPFTIPLAGHRDELQGRAVFSVLDPHLWTAETPDLYTLVLRLYDGAREEQVICERIGLRQVSIQNGRLLVNGTAIKLRGIDIHQTSPDRGSALTEEYLCRDFDLLKKANINFIRTSHYPPPPRFLQLCDSLGFYVMEEVPFGDGDHLLTDQRFQSILCQRALATVQRDHNRPSAIVWSLGNENPITSLTDSLAHYVKALDPTRPVCYPQTGPYFHEHHQQIKDFIDIYAPHYTVPARLQEYDEQLSRPIIVTEYAHSLGLDMDMMQNLWEVVMYHGDHIAGGAVWDFADQGILRKARFPVNRQQATPHVWLDAYHYYDSCTSKGTDGIVYADRTPQPDYYQVKNVYAPVRVPLDTLFVAAGRQMLEFPVENRYDFTDLSKVKMVYELYCNDDLLQKGQLDIAGSPHAVSRARLSVSLSERLDQGYYLLKLNFFDKNGMHLLLKTIRLIFKGTTVDWIKKLAEPVKITATLTTNTMEVVMGRNVFSCDKTTGAVRMSSGVDKKIILKHGMMLRVGRKPTLASQSVLDRHPTENVDYLWLPYVLDQPQWTSTHIDTAADSVVISQALRFQRDQNSGQCIEGTIRYVLDGTGWIHVHYRFTPIRTTGVFLEAGLSFVVPADLNQMRWVGLGPYPSYPDKDRLDQFGLYRMDSRDLYFQGNRGRIEAVLFIDPRGGGLMMVAHGGPVAVENTSEGILISHNALVSSRFNKYVKPLHEINAASEFSGRFSLRIIHAGEWSGLLYDVFGNPLEAVEPFRPFYHSYDQ
jgi:beta-galactosidase